jgi:hypothetical protein
MERLWKMKKMTVEVIFKTQLYQLTLLLLAGEYNMLIEKK